MTSPYLHQNFTPASSYLAPASPSPASLNSPVISSSIGTFSTSPTISISPQNIKSKSASTSKPRGFAKWEDPELSQIRINKFHTKQTLYSAIALFLCSVILFLINHAEENTREFMLDMLLVGLSTHLDPLIGDIISGILLILAIIGFIRYFPPNYIPPTLSNKKRKLLGLPLLPVSSPTGVVISPTVPRTLPSPQVQPQPISFSPKASIPGRVPLSPSYYGSPSAITPTKNTEQSLVRRTPSSQRQEHEIKDVRALDDYLARFEKTEKIKSQLAGGVNVGMYGAGTDTSALGMGTSTGQTPTLMKYRTSYLPPPRVSSRDSEFAAMNIQLAQELLDKLGIANKIDDWTENMRKWLVDYVLHPLVRKFDVVEQFGLSMNVSPPPLPAPGTSTASNMPLWHSAPVVQPTNSIPNPTPGGAPIDANELLRKRHRLEKYTKVLGATSREYLIQRIRELAKGSYMAEFKWNGGGLWKGKEWSQEFPTDAQIVFHLFCTFMDFVLPDQQSANGKPFTGKYVAISETPDLSKSSVILYQRQVHPPHFEVVSSHPTEVWQVMQGRSNLFQALVLFIYCVKQKLCGYLGQILLSTSQINLLCVVEND